MWLDYPSTGSRKSRHHAEQGGRGFRCLRPALVVSAAICGEHPYRHQRYPRPDAEPRDRPPDLQGGIYCLTSDPVRFVWDARKAAANLKKHRVSFEEASTAFADELGAYYPDSLHEDRFILIGYSRQQRLLYVVHAEVTPDAIRIISARKATKHEKTRYEND